MYKGNPYTGSIGNANISYGSDGSIIYTFAGKGISTMSGVYANITLTGLKIKNPDIWNEADVTYTYTKTTAPTTDTYWLKFVGANGTYYKQMDPNQPVNVTPADNIPSGTYTVTEVVTTGANPKDDPTAIIDPNPYGVVISNGNTLNKIQPVTDQRYVANESMQVTIGATGSAPIYVNNIIRALPETSAAPASAPVSLIMGANLIVETEKTTSAQNAPAVTEQAPVTTTKEVPASAESNTTTTPAVKNEVAVPAATEPNNVALPVVKNEVSVPASTEPNNTTPAVTNEVSAPAATEPNNVALPAVTNEVTETVTESNTTSL